MIDDLTTRRKLLDGPDIVGRLGDDYFAELARQMAVDDDPMPRVVLTGDAADGTTIRIVDVTVIGRTDQDPIQRGFLWVAMLGTFNLIASHRVGTMPIACRIVGGTRIFSSTRSAQHALDGARRVLDAGRVER